MEKNEKKIEQVNYIPEKERIRKQRLDAQNAAEIRRAKIENREDLEIGKSIEGKSLSKSPTSDEVAILRRKHNLADQHDGARLEQLAHSKNLSEVQTKELQENLEHYLDKTDSFKNDADRLTDEGLLQFQKNGDYRREFCHLAGTEEHSRWEDEIVKQEQSKGHKRGVDFDIEAVMKHPDGKLVRLDYVDYQKGIIIDRKSFENIQTEEQLKKKYERQRNRHIEAYEHTTGQKVNDYFYSPYPSPRDI